jgi:hypothetical protein
MTRACLVLCTVLTASVLALGRTGQDQMRVVKQRLVEMVPDMEVFLDVRRRGLPHDPPKAQS